MFSNNWAKKSKFRVFCINYGELIIILCNNKITVSIRKDKEEKNELKVFCFLKLVICRK